ncbi:MAG: penicillin-binding protein 2 [Candidatus Hydrogenedentes bacterium]|nr:penicillin-binding protein 2 [Candidatus Hydrogenedentota bacterium]
MTGTAQKKRYEGFEGRVTWLAFALLLALAGLCVRLWELQVIEGAQYADQAENNRLMNEPLKSPRGIIYGRDERVVLADNRAANDLVLVPALCSDPQSVIETLSQIIEVNKDALLADIASAEKRKAPWEQIRVKQDISRTELTLVEERSFALPGVYTVARPQRRYYYNQTAGQLLGFINKILPDEWERLRPRYKIDDVTGRAGLEQQYQEVLKGTDGAMIVSRYNGSVPQLKTDERGNPYVETDSKGRALEVEERIEPVPGGSIFTTLDIGLQRECERLLSGMAGAAVVLNAETGEVLAMASSPGYDPSIYVTNSPDRDTLIRTTEGDPSKPSSSRAHEFHYPPGSVFKVLLAIAGLEEGVINEHTTFGCSGKFYLPGVSRPWRCWRLRYGGHGGVGVVDALAYSCDVYFYNVGLKLGPERIKAWSSKLGLGVTTGIDLPREVPGLIPDPERKKRLAIEAKKTEPWYQKWYPGETVNMSIGQGEVVTTPLQNAVLMASVLNGGRRVRPYLNMELGPQVTEPLFSEETLRIVMEGMRKCVARDKPAPTGTGKEAKIEGLDILGKTGTAQVAGLQHVKHYSNEEDIPYELRDHALFVSGVTDRSPRIAVSVIVEHGLHGSSTAAPIARQIYEYFYLKRPDEPGSASVAQPLTIARREAGE